MSSLYEEITLREDVAEYLYCNDSFCIKATRKCRKLPILVKMIHKIRYMEVSAIAAIGGDITRKALPNIVPADKLERDSICYPRFDMNKIICRMKRC